MYVLSISVNGETVRTDAFASVIDATDDYASVLATSYPLALPTDAEIATEYLTSPDVHTVTASWEVPNVASDAGEGPTESDAYTVRLARVSAEDVESDGIPFVGSRAVVLPDVETVETVESIGDVVREALATISA